MPWLPMRVQQRNAIMFCLSERASIYQLSIITGVIVGSKSYLIAKRMEIIT
jgi:hypothetical protein